MPRTPSAENESHFLISASQTVASHSYRRFAGGQNAGRRFDRIPGPGNLTPNCRKETPDVFRFAFHFSSENQSIEVQFPSLADRGLNQKLIVRNNMVGDVFENRIAGLRRFRNMSTRAFL